MIVKTVFLTHAGKVRPNNEDSLLLPDGLIGEGNMIAPACRAYTGARLLFMVADGIGGHEKGEWASRTVLEVFREQAASLEALADIFDTIQTAHRRLNLMARQDFHSLGLGTTVTGMLFLDERTLVFSCGDSRLYRRDGDAFERLTRDHTLVQDLVDSGQLPEDGMRTHPCKNILTSAVMGNLKDAPPEIFSQEIGVTAGQRFLLCTDGVWECMTMDEMKACFEESSLESIVETLYKKIMTSGARDNFTMLALEREV